jgi:hypothetical protein
MVRKPMIGECADNTSAGLTYPRKVRTCICGYSTINKVSISDL